MVTSRRIWILKYVMLAVLIFLCVHIVTNSSTSAFIRDLQQSGRNLASLDQNAINVQDDLPAFPEKQQQQAAASPLVQPVVNYFTNVVNVTLEATVPSTTRSPEVVIAERVRELTQCLDRQVVPKIQQRGDYWVMYNYVRADKQFKCHESITYSTHADYTFLDNILPLMDRWRGPISIALHAPGTDFQKTIESIAHLRDCTSPLIREFVTFHVYFSAKHVPKQVPPQDKVLLEPYNCSLTPPYLNFSSDQMYKMQKKLLYPVNVGRNIAREMSQTHFLLASDIELYPSPNVISKFLKMIADNKDPLPNHQPRVFPLSIFEVNSNVQIPDNKTQLQEMLANKTAFPFHKNLCPGCHNVPKSKEWQTAPETEGLNVFHIGKRNGRYIHWEPIYIGTHDDPLYDERLSWEGMSDKMTQGYALCVLDYNFMILDNAFMVHRPGIKVLKKDPKRAVLAAKTNLLIKKVILPEMKVIYGVRKGCAV